MKIIDERAAIEAQISSLARTLAELNAPPADPYEDDTVLFWKRNFSGSVYTYAALRARSMWFITGRNQSSTVGHRWISMYDQHLKHTLPDSLWVADVWLPVDDL